MALRLVAPPPVEPVNLEQMKAHLRVTSSDEDGLIAGICAAARTHAESILKRSLITQTWDLTLDRFPAWFVIPKPPLQSVSHIKYLDDSGVEQTLDASLYRVDAASEPGRVVPAYGQVWPSTYPEINAVRLRFVAGYEHGAGSPAGWADNVPATVVQAIKLLGGHFYENREAVSAAANLQDLPLGVQVLLTSEICWGG